MCLRFRSRRYHIVGSLLLTPAKNVSDEESNDEDEVGDSEECGSCGDSGYCLVVGHDLSLSVWVHVVGDLPAVRLAVEAEVGTPPVRDRVNGVHGSSPSALALIGHGPVLSQCRNDTAKGGVNVCVRCPVRE